MYLLENIDLEDKPKFIFADGEKIVKTELKPLMKEIIKCIEKCKHGKIVASLLMLLYYCAIITGNILRVVAVVTRTKEKIKKRAEYNLNCRSAQLNGLILAFSVRGIYIDDIIERVGGVEVKEKKE